MTWVKFLDRKEFDAWHDARCAERGIPHPNENQASREFDLAAQWTTAYVEPLAHKDGYLVVSIPDGDDIDGLEATEAPRLSPASINEVFAADAIRAFDVAKPLPAEWLVDGELVAVPASVSLEL